MFLPTASKCERWSNRLGCCTRLACALCWSTAADRSRQTCGRTGARNHVRRRPARHRRASLDVATMVLNGQINTRILAACRDLELPAVGISGVDAGLIKATRRPPVDAERRWLGRLRFCRRHRIRRCRCAAKAAGQRADARRESAVLRFIRYDSQHQRRHRRRRHCRGAWRRKTDFRDRGAGHSRDKDDPQSLISYVDRQALARLRESGSLADGMLPKAAAIDAAISTASTRARHFLQDP